MDQVLVDILAGMVVELAYRRSSVAYAIVTNTIARALSISCAFVFSFWYQGASFRAAISCELVHLIC